MGNLALKHPLLRKPFEVWSFWTNADDVNSELPTREHRHQQTENVCFWHLADIDACAEPLLSEAKRTLAKFAAMSRMLALARLEADGPPAGRNDPPIDLGLIADDSPYGGGAPVLLELAADSLPGLSVVCYGKTLMSK